MRSKKNKYSFLTKSALDDEKSHLNAKNKGIYM